MGVLLIGEKVSKKGGIFLNRAARRILTIVLIAAVLASLSISAFASTDGTRTYSWLQATKPTVNGLCGTLSVDDDNTVILQGVATSSESGQFSVKLQKQVGIFWFDVGNIYAVQQHHDRTYDTVNKKYVIGQFFRLYWNISSKASYRVVLYSPTNPQVCGLTEMRFYIQ